MTTDAVSPEVLKSELEQLKIEDEDEEVDEIALKSALVEYRRMLLPSFPYLCTHAHVSDPGELISYTKVRRLSCDTFQNGDPYVQPYRNV